jgi:MscS family membrane protein
MDGPELARQLREILDRRLTSDPGLLSNAPEGDLTDGLGPHLELLGTVQSGDRALDLLLERSGSGATQMWLVSAATVHMIPAIHEGLDEYGIEARLPHWLRVDGPLGTPVWVWVGLLLLMAISVAFTSLLVRLVIRILRPLLRLTATDFDDRLLESVINPLRLLLAVVAVRAGMAALPVSVLLRTYLGRVLAALAYAALAWFVLRLIDLVATRALARMTGRQRASASSVIPLGRRSAKAAAVVIAILATLHTWGYDTTALLAGLGVGGLAIALAAQKTIENLFGGVSITSDKPVLVGDFCRYGDKFGIVEDIGLRSTRVRTLDRTVVTIPNGQFAALEIENFGPRDKFWFHPVFQIRRDATPDQLRRLIAGIRDILLAHPDVDPDPARVRFIAISAYSFDIEVFSYVKTTAMDHFLIVQETVLLQILDLIRETGTALAVPAQLNLVGRDPMRSGGAPSAAPAAEDGSKSTG